ncbi:MAG: hypothetical protein AAB439_01970 [Patescibacteria group bacterium]
MKIWSPFRKKKIEGEVVESGEQTDAPKKKSRVLRGAGKVARAGWGALKNLFKFPKNPAGDVVAVGATAIVTAAVVASGAGEGDEALSVNEGTVSETPSLDTETNASEFPNESVEESFAPLPELAVDAVPGDGAITMISKWAEVAAADPNINSEQLGGTLGALVEAARSGGDVYALAEALAKESGLYQPNEALNSFNVFSEGALRLQYDGSGGYSLTMVNPGGDSHILLAISSEGVETKQPPYAGDQMITPKK